MRFPRGKVEWLPAHVATQLIGGVDASEAARAAAPSHRRF